MFEVETRTVSGQPAAVGHVDRIAEIPNSLRGATQVKLSPEPAGPSG